MTGIELDLGGVFPKDFKAIPGIGHRKTNDFQG